MLRNLVETGRFLVLDFFFNLFIFYNIKTLAACISTEGLTLTNINVILSLIDKCLP